MYDALSAYEALVLPDAYEALVAKVAYEALVEPEAYEALAIELVPNGPHTPEAVIKDAVKAFVAVPADDRA